MAHSYGNIRKYSCFLYRHAGAWILSKCASEAFGKQVNVKTLFSQYMKKEGGSTDQFLKEAFTK